MGFPRLLPPEEGWVGFPAWVVDDDRDLRTISVHRDRWSDEWPWSVSYPGAEMARTPALETMVETQMSEALRAVVGVRRVVPEDRGVWQISGRTSGLLLLFAASRVARRLEPAITSSLRQT